MNIQHTKIVCTIGPASRSLEKIKNMILEGMSVARLNFSHGTHEEHLETINNIRRAAKETERAVAILQDLGGPKIRVGKIPEPGLRLEAGTSVVLTTRSVEAGENVIPVNYQALAGDVLKGDRIILADGFMELEVTGTSATDVQARVITGGMLTSHKGINLPTRSIRVPSLTPKDEKDLAFGIENGVDFVALSFVRKPEDVEGVKRIIERRGANTPVIAKIEKHEAISNLDSILEVSDAVMVARGDLGVEIPLEEVPIVQKMLIEKANSMGKPVITATQMLRSMVDSPRPTRAEATDVANAVLDGTDAVMLSEETASGRYPVEAVAMLRRIIMTTESKFPHERYLSMRPERNVPDSVAHASCVLAHHLGVSAIVAPTQSGQTARCLSRFRPRTPILALSPQPTTVRRLTLVWGCMPRLVPSPRDTDDMIELAAETVLETGLVEKGETVVITAGQPVWVAGSTNMLRVKTL
jgi:pyruvate kinase